MKKKNNSRFMDLVDRAAAGENPAASSFYDWGQRLGDWLFGPAPAAASTRVFHSLRNRSAAAVRAGTKPAPLKEGSLQAKMQAGAVKIQKRYRRYRKVRSVAGGIIRLAEKLL